MRSTYPIAILCSDIHLSYHAPLCRREEKSWFKAMESQLCQLRDLQSKLDVPIVCAGDVFDRWNCPPELINFALDSLPTMFAIPGQHDLPFHNYKLIKRSAFWTLVRARRLVLVPPEGLNYQGLKLFGFGWGRKIRPPTKPIENICNLAVVHKFVWDKPNNAYTGAPTSSTVTAMRKLLRGYDVAVFGDNHKGFVSGNIVNCGTFFRRTSQDFNYRPSVWILNQDRSITRHRLDLDGEVMNPRTELKTEIVNSHDFNDALAGLASLEADPLDFIAILGKKIRKADPRIRNIIRRVIEEVSNECT